MLEDEFPPEEDPEDILNREHEEAAIQRLEMDIEERFMTDENNLALVMVVIHHSVSRRHTFCLTVQSHELHTG